MKRLFVVMIALFLLSFTCSQDGTIKQFSWLEGGWTMKTKRGAIIEWWQTKNDSLMTGSSKMAGLNGDEKMLETLELIFTSGSYYYVSRVSGQNNGEAVWFKITSYSEKGFVAENPEHDFPKRITYDLVNKDSIHAFIDGGPALPGKKSDFYYTRNQN